MCGIAGMVAADALHPADARRVASMRDVMAHRGPDESGLHVDGSAVLGHRRLSIVDLAAGQQPLANEDHTVWITYNGEIYNHAQLRRELEAAGHVYRTRCDTETIVHAYEEWGDDCVHRFRGMFAFAIWDARRQRLLLARDRLGIKPLYWTLANGRLIFASEIKAILESRLVAVRPNEAALPELLATRALAGSETMFKGVFKLMPGHVLWFAEGRVGGRRYWDVPMAAPSDAGAEPLRDQARRFRALLEESIRLRLMSDVPLGVFLSGGIDSSAIAALAATMTGTRLDTFSVAFEERAFSELEYARVVSRAIGAKCHEIVIGDRDFFGALPRLIWHEDEPIAHPSSVPLYFVSRLARDHVKVVLTGEGSDELLAGYGKYARALYNWRAGELYARAVPGTVKSLIANLVARLPWRAGRYARRSFLAVDHTVEAMLFDNFSAIGLPAQRKLLSPRLAAFATDERAYGPSLAFFNAVQGHLLDRLLYTDLKTYLVELLMKQDQMSMAASIESRVPFLDHHLVEFSAGLAPDRKLSGFVTKRILRQALLGVLPSQILERPKMGFPVPLGHWLRNGWSSVARDVLLDRRSRERGVFTPAAVERLLAGVAVGDNHAADAVWSLMNVELWYRTFADGEGIQTLPAPARLVTLSNAS